MVFEFMVNGRQVVVTATDWGNAYYLEIDVNGIELDEYELMGEFSPENVEYEARAYIENVTGITDRIIGE